MAATRHNDASNSIKSIDQKFCSAQSLREQFLSRRRKCDCTFDAGIQLNQFNIYRMLLPRMNVPDCYSWLYKCSDVFDNWWLQLNDEVLSVLNPRLIIYTSYMSDRIPYSNANDSLLAYYRVAFWIKLNELSPVKTNITIFYNEHSQKIITKTIVSITKYYCFIVIVIIIVILLSVFTLQFYNEYNVVRLSWILTRYILGFELLRNIF